MKRIVIVSGLVAALAIGIPGVAAIGQASSQDLKEAKTIAALQQQYKGLNADDVRFHEWRALSQETKIPTEQERQQELTQIDREANRLVKEKKQSEAAKMDGEQAVQAVGADLAGGKLTKEDADMLLKMFKEKVDEANGKIKQSSDRLVQLESRKHELTAFKQPDVIYYTQAEVDRGWKTYMETVFFNENEQRLLTDAEIMKNSAAAKVNEKPQTMVSSRAVKNIMVAGGLFVILIALACTWSNSQEFGRRLSKYRILKPKA